MVEISLHGAVLGYTVGKGRGGKERDLEVFQALEKGCEGGAYVGVAQGDHPEGGVCLLVRQLLLWRD